MKTEFDFQQVGKRTPYRVPEGFFDTFQQQVMAEARHRRQLRSRRRTLWLSLAGVAGIAAAILCFVLPVGHDLVPEVDNVSWSNLAAVPTPTTSLTAQHTAPAAPEAVAAEAEVPAPEAAPKATSRPAARQRQEASASEYEYIASMTDEDLDEVVSMIQADPFLLAAGDYYSDPLSE